VQDNPSQSFSAGFELRGSAGAGELSLYNPLGGTLAVMAWEPGSATLRSGNEVRRFDSIDALAAQASGTPIPVTALFDWLAGSNTPVPGWTADLSQLPEGRIRARRVEPLPEADLRVAIDRPQP
jgi:outer membrane lipoprotein LolB